MFNLLSDPVFRTDRGILTLPQLLEAMMTEDCPPVCLNLRPHQEQGWFCFLAQLAAIAMDRFEGLSWKDRLLGLSNGSEDPWSLVVDNPAQPAFLQCPWESSGDDTEFRCPDDIDVLQSKRELTLKSSLIQNASPDFWVFSLVCKQTLINSCGVGWAGSSRTGMKMGRAFVGVICHDAPGKTFRNHVGLMLRNRLKIAGLGFAESDGKALLWMYPWPSDPEKAKGFLIGELDPYFIDTARNYRLFNIPAGITCKGHSMLAGSKYVFRATLPDNMAGSGDPWCPQWPGKNGPYAKGFRGDTNFRTLAHLMSACRVGRQAGGEVMPSMCQEILAEDRGRTDLALLAEGFELNQGKDPRLFRREIPLPPIVINLGLSYLDDEDDTEDSRKTLVLSDYVKDILDLADQVEVCLKKATGPIQRIPGKNQIFSVFLRSVDKEFFDRLVAGLPETPCPEIPGTTRSGWFEWIAKAATQALEEMTEVPSVPHPNAVKAETVLRINLAKLRRKYCGNVQ